MQHRKYLIYLLPLVFLLSCKDKETEPRPWAAKERYMIASYIRPTFVSLSKEAYLQERKYTEAKIYFTSDEEIDLKSSPEQYKELALAHKESGKEVFYWWHPPFRKVPCGIKKIQFFGTNSEGKEINISDKVQVAYRKYKDFILSGYKKSYEIEGKLASSLTEEDLNWLTNPLDISLLKKYDKLRVEITLETGTIIKSQ